MSLKNKCYATEQFGQNNKSLSQILNKRYHEYIYIIMLRFPKEGLPQKIIETLAMNGRSFNR